jgi:hypothetical protein
MVCEQLLEYMTEELWTGIKKRNNRAWDDSGSLVHYNIISAALCNAVKDARVRPLLLLG